MRQQHLDPINVEFGILQVLDLLMFSQQNLELGVALQRAINEWQIECWSKPEPRLKASIVVGQDNTEAAVAEIERCAATGKYVQVNVSPRANEPLGRRRYWPIYAAARLRTCRSASMSAATAATRQREAAGPPTTTRSTIPTPTRWRLS